MCLLKVKGEYTYRGCFANPLIPKFSKAKVYSSTNCHSAPKRTDPAQTDIREVLLNKVVENEQIIITIIIIIIIIIIMETLFVFLNVQ